MPVASTRSRALFIGAPLAALAIAGAYAGYWALLSHKITAGIEDWAAARRMEGWIVTYGGLRTGGTPLAIRVDIDNPTVVSPQGWAWRGPALTATVPMLNPKHIHIEAPGAHDFGMPVTGPVPLALTAAKAQADLALDVRGTFDSTTITLEDVQLLQQGSDPYQLSRLSLHGEVVPTLRAAGPKTPTFSFDASLRSLDLPEAATGIFESRVTSASIRGAVMGSFPRTPLQQAVATWRDEGGSIDIDTLSVDWPPMKLNSSGTLTLDRDLQPAATLTGNFQGFFEAVDALSRAGQIRTRDASMAKIMLGLLAKPNGNGNGPALQIPITIQNRDLYAGSVNLAQMPRISWTVPATKARLPNWAERSPDTPMTVKPTQVDDVARPSVSFGAGGEPRRK